MGQGGVGGQGAAQSPSKEMQLWGVFPAPVQADAEQHHQLYAISLSNTVPLTLLMSPSGWAPAPQKHPTVQICTSAAQRQPPSLICFIPQPEELHALGESNCTFWIINRKQKKVIPLPQPHEQQLLFYSSRGGSKLSFLVVTFIS